MRVRENKEPLIGRIPILRFSLALALGIILITYWSTQVIRGEEFSRLADNNRLRKLAIQAPRGLIHDRKGVLLVENVPSYNLLIDRSQSTQLPASLRFASAILERPVDELELVLERYESKPSFHPVLIAEDLSLSQVAQFGVAGLEHPEFEISVRHLRLYRHGPQTAHVLGYLGEVNEQDLAPADSPYEAGDLIGKKGIERAFDELLRGEDGEQVVVVDSRGRRSEEFARESALAGEPLELTLDLELQQEAVRYMDGKVGAVVAMDPTNGAILAMTSTPSFNANEFARRLERSEWQALIENEHHPLQNRAVQSTYPLGSIFKIVVSAAGLGEGLVDGSDTVFCNGSVRLYNRRIRCWKPSGHGWVSLKKALKESCDVYYYLLGQKLGIQSIADYARRFGLGRATSIELGGERSGLVPDPEWSQRVRGGPWFPGETISVAIGQGPLLVTPLQVARMMAAVANGGTLVTPHLTSGHLTSDSIAKQESIDIRSSHLDSIKNGLWAVVNDKKGTGARARVEGIDIYGKTSTVQVIRQKTWINSDSLPWKHRDHAWFASFAAHQGRELVVVIFVEHGGKGSRAAAPLAKVLYEKYFENDLSIGSAG